MGTDGVLDTVAGEGVADVAPTATLRDAAAEMTSNEVGALLVVHANGAVGVLSERDIVRALGDGADPDEERVGDWCSDDLVKLPSTASLEEAVRTMQAAQVRHLVVTDADGGRRMVSLRGVVARRDELSTAAP